MQQKCSPPPPALIAAYNVINAVVICHVYIVSVRPKENSRRKHRVRRPVGRIMDPT